MRAGIHTASMVRSALVGAALLVLGAGPAHAQTPCPSSGYCNRFSVIRNGAVTFTGNTLGLSKAANQNQPGTNDSIGAFITTNTGLRVGTYPAGTTLNFGQNSSSATLDLPAGSTVLYAELTWAGSYSFGGQTISEAARNAPVSLTTPAGTFSISADPTFQRNLGTPAPLGLCLGGDCLYARTANVTARVQEGGAGVYTVGNVAATVGASENNSNAAGWTLAVVYQNFTLPARNLTLFVGSEPSNGPAAQASGFCTPTSGSVSGRLAVSAIEGDANKGGDTMRFGPTSALPDSTRLQGTNNPRTNFFASQINGDGGALDTSGTFGALNQNASAGTNIAGGRQGWDITNVDVSAQLQNNQTQAFARGTTTGETYMITTLALQINVGAPAFSPSKSVDKAATFVGDRLTYTIVLPNTGTAGASNVVFTDAPPPGTTFVAGSFSVDGVVQPAANPATGVNLGTIAAGASRTVRFQVQVTSVPPSPAPARYDNTANVTYGFVSCAGQPMQTGTAVSNIGTTLVPRIEASKVANRAIMTAGGFQTYAITISNTGTAAASGVTLTDAIPPGTTYRPGTTTLNDVAVADVGGMMPFAQGRLVNSPGAPPGQLAPNESAVVLFQVMVDLAATGTITNSAQIDPDGPGPLPAIPATVATPVISEADLAVTKDGPDRATAGTTLAFTNTVTNQGPSNATGVVLSDPTPSGLTFVSNSGGCTTPFPCNLGTLGPGATRTVTTTFLVPAGYTTPDPIVNQITVSSGTTDPVASNNAATASASLNAPVANLTVTKSNGTTSVIPGTTTTYTITVGNTGPSNAAGVRVTDPVPTGVSGVTWTCSGSGGASCVAASGTGALDTTVNLPAGTSATFLLTATVAPDFSGPLSNTARAATPPGFGGTASATATDVDQLQPQADVSVTKAGPATVTPGTDAVYTIFVRNAGPSVAREVSVSDPAPTGLSFVSTAGDCTTAFPCALGTLQPGSSRTITATFAVPLGYTTPNPIVNTATIATASPDPNTANDTATTQTPVNTNADVEVLKSIAPTSALVGDTVSVFVSALNNGPNRASGLVVTDALPAGLTFVSASPQQGSYTASTGQWLVGDLASGGSTTLTLTATVAQPGTITNVATKTAANEPDPDSSNDSATATLDAAAAADLAVQKTGPIQATAGANVVFTIAVTNQGPSPATSVSVADPTPAGLTFVSTSGDCTTTFPCALGTLPAGQTRTITATFAVPAGYAGADPIVNTATASSPTVDRDPTNNTASASAPLARSADVSITKTGPASAVPGSDLVYTIVVRNDGPSDATGVQVTDATPAGLTFVSNAGACTTPFPCALGTVPAGTTQTITTTFAVPASYSGPSPLANTATVSAVTNDPAGANNSATASTAVQPTADVSVTKVAPATTAAGGTITYTVTVQNAGPSDAPGVVVTDPTPAGLGFVANSGDCATAFPCDLGTVPVGATRTITTTLSVPADYNVPPGSDPDPIPNTASVTTTALDPASGNNSQTASTALNAPVTDLTVSKTDDVPSVVPGQSTTYTIVVTNNGPAAATGAQVQDTLPTGATGATWTCTPGGPGSTCAASGTGAINEAVSMIPGGSVTFQLTITVPPDASGELVNTVTAEPGPGASDPTPATATDTDTLTPQADLAITKTGPATVVPGNTATYTITVTNMGPSGAQGVEVADATPPGTFFESNAGACTTPFPCELGTIPAGQSRTITTSFSVPLGYASDTLVNTASVSGATADPASGNNSATVTTAVDLAADVAITKSVSPTGPVLVGDQVTFTVTAANVGPNQASGVRITDGLPAGLVLVSATTSQGTYSPGTGLWDVGTLAAGEPPVTLTIVATVAQPGGVTNTATKTAAIEPDPNTSNDSSVATTNVTAAADVGVSKTVDNAAPNVGESVTFTVTATNAGPSPATAVEITDSLPTGLTLTTATPSQGAYNAGTGVWSVGSLAVNGSATLTLAATVATAGPLANTASKTAQTEPDRNPANDSSTTSLNAATSADLQVSKAASNPNPPVGTEVTYTLTARNNGPSPATNAQVTEALPIGLTFVSAVASLGSYDAASGMWSIGSLAATQSATLAVTARVEPPLATIVNSVSATANEPDPQLPNNSATTSITGTLVSDVSVTKSDGMTIAVPGAPVTYTLVVTNAGPSPVADASVNDPIPASLTGVSWTCTPSAGSSCDAATGTGAVATTVDLLSGGQATFTVTGTLSPSAPAGTLSNTATVGVPPGVTDPQSPNNTATDTSTITPSADVSITKSGSATFTPGTTIAFTLTVTNAGPSDATNVTIDDPPGPELTFNAGASTVPCGTLPCDLGTLAAGASQTVTVAFDVPPGYAGPNPIVNTATVTSPTPDPVGVNNMTSASTTNGGPVTDLGVTKTNGVDSVVTGGTVTYTIRVTNAGPSAAVNALVSDVLDPARIVSGSATWTCVATGSAATSCGSPSGTGDVATSVSIAPDPGGTTEFVTLTVTAQVRGDATGTLVNTVIVTPPPGSADPTPPSAVDTDTVVPQADLAVTKTGAAVVSPGNPLTYQLVVTNHGPAPAVDVTVSDPTPAGLGFVANTGDCTTAFPCALGTLPAGASRTITTTFTVPFGYVQTSVTNIATVASTTADPTPDNDSATATTPVDLSADVAVTKTVSPSTGVLVGDRVTYTVSVENRGPNQASGVEVTDQLPAGLTLVTATPSQGTYDAALGAWSIGTLPPAGPPQTLTIVARVDQPGTIANTATKTMAGEPDPDPSNDSSVAPLNAGPAADVGLRKTVDNPAPNVGETVTFIVEATNRGPSPATDLVVVDTLPAGLTLLSATPSQGAFASGSWTVGTLAPDATATLTLMVSIDAPGAAVNVATRSTQNETDPNPANDSATAGVNAGASADLQVTKTVSNAAPPVGTNVTFTVTARNNGPSPASGVTIADTLPAGLTFVAATASLGAYDAGAGVWTVGSLAATQSAVLSLTARADVDQTLTNTASVSTFNEPDPIGNNTGSADLTPVFVTDLAVTKTDGAETVTPGLPVAYTVTVSNAGPSPAIAARVVDALPAGLAGATWTCQTTAPAMCQTASGVGDIDALVDLPAGVTATFSVTATLLASTPPGTLANTATVTPPPTATDPDPGNNSSTDTSTVVPEADLAQTKVQTTPVPPAPVSAGGTLVYTLTVSNAGPSDATGVVVADATPTGLVFGGNTGACTTPFPCALGTLAAGATETITTTYMVPANYNVPSGSAPDPIVNVASVSSSTSDPNPPNDTSTASSPLGAPVASLAVTKTNGTDTVVPGQSTTYTIVVSNAGPAVASGARVSDPLPAGALGATWTCAPGPAATCPPGGSGDIDALVTLPVGGSVTFTATVAISPTAAGTFGNTVTVTPPPGVANPIPASTTDTDLVERQADLSVTKTGPATIVPGDVAAYTLVVTNDGPSEAPNVQVADPTPPDTVFLATSGDCTSAFPCVLGTLQPGETRTITASFEVPLGYPRTTLINTASVQGGATDPDPSDNSANVTTDVNLDADVAVTKVVNPSDLVRVGDQVTFTITARNLGPNQATGVEVTDVVPAGLTLVSATPSPGAYDLASGRWIVGTLVAGGGAATLTLTVTVDQPGMLTNPATKTAGDQPDPDPSNDSAAAQFNAVPSADVGLAKTVDNAAPNVGERVTFTVEATNRGPSPATAVQVTDLLPAGLGLTAATPSQGTYTAASGVWDIGNLAVGGSATLTLTATVDTAGTLVNQASKSAQGESDPSPANDRTSVSLNAATSADLQVTKAASNPTPPVGGEVTFTVTVRNNGPSPASGVTIDDALPAGLTFVSATASLGTYDAGAGVWTVGALAATQSAVLSLTARADGAETLINTASRSGGNEEDPNPDNDTSSVSILPSLVADLVVTKTHGAVAVTPGLPVTYTITVSNAGPSPVLGARVVDTLPAALAGATWTCQATAPAACQTASGAGDIDALVDLPAGTMATFRLTATVAASTISPTLANTAAVTLPPGTVDPDPRTNSSTDTSVVTPTANLQVAKVQTVPSPPASVSPGGTLVYTITVSNAGPSDAAGVVVTDPTPTGLVFSGNTGACTTPYPCTLGTLPAGATATITTTYTLPADYNVPPGSAPDPIVNVATASSSTLEGDPQDNEVTTTSPLGPLTADLSIAKSGPSTLLPGSPATYTIVVTNRGPGVAPNVRVDDPTPPDTIFVSTGGDCTTPFPCALGTLLPGETHTITATFDVPVGYARGTLANTATLAGDVVDPSPGDQRATATTTVNLNADVAVAKTASPASGVAPGDEVTFTITASNLGPNHASGVEIMDVLPAGLTLVSTTASQGAYDAASGRWPVGTLRAAQSASLALRVRIEPPAGTSSPTGAFVNTASRTAGDQPDPDTSNDTASATVRSAFGEQVCDDCRDDDGDGLVDAEDPDCCAPQTLTITRARLQPARSRLRVRATMASGAFAGIDPRQQDVRLQIRNQEGEAVCCTIPRERWTKVLGRVHWFRDKTMDTCPPIKGLCLIVPKQGRTKTVIVAGKQTPSSGLGSPLEVTLSAGGQCVQGNVSLRPRGRSGEVFP